MPEIIAEIEVYCAECGAGLCGNTRTSVKRGMPQVVVEPCDKCLEKEYTRGYDAHE